MRKLIFAAALAALVLVPTFQTRLALPGFAQAATGPQGDEFNNTLFTQPFAPRCGLNPLAQPCPDPQGPNTWSLNGQRPGFLRLMTQFGSLVGSAADSSNNARNFVVQPVNPAADYTVTTSLNFPGAGAGNVTPLGQTGGLLVYQDDDHLIYLGRRLDANGQSQIQFLQEDGPTNHPANTIVETGFFQPTVYLRLTKTGTLYTGFYSYDNVTFTPVNPYLVPTPTATATGTATGTATATATGTLTDTPTSTATSTATVTATDTPTATPTSIPNPTGYTASYAAPQVGVFAWGGTNGAAANNVIPADFDWFRVGNSSLPAATATATSTGTSTVTLTPTATGTPQPTSTSTATNTATATSTATATATATSTPTPTATPKPKKPQVAFAYTSIWYHTIRIGTRQHIQAQAKRHKQHGIWVTVQFASGRTLHYYTVTDRAGFWFTEFTIPKNTISKFSHDAVVTFQLWSGNRTKKSFSGFTVVR